MSGIIKSQAIELASNAVPLPSRAQQEAKIRGYFDASLSENTRKNYLSILHRYVNAGYRLPSSLDEVLVYLSTAADTCRPSALSVHRAAISQWHQFNEFPDPTKTKQVDMLMKGIRKKHRQPPKRAYALSIDEVANILSCLTVEPTAIQAVRDAALVAIGYFACLRASELVGLHVDDLNFSKDGVVLSIRASKTDQDGQGLLRGVPRTNGSLCPVSLLQRWLSASRIEQGPVFRSLNRWHQLSAKALSTNSVSQVVQRCAKQAGVREWESVSSHSLRRGFATSASRIGADFGAIKRQGGWQKDDTVRVYIEEGEILQDNAALPLLDALSEFSHPRQKLDDSK